MFKKNYKIPLSLFALIILICLFLGWFTYRAINSTKQQIINEMELELARIERNLFDNIDYTESLISSINANIGLDPRNKQHIFNILKNYRDYQKFNKTSSWTIFSWLDDKGQLIVDAKYGILAKPIDNTEKENTPKFKSEPDRLHIGSPMIGTTSQKLIIPLGMGSRDSAGKYLGATIVGFEIDSLARILYNVMKNPDINFKLLSDSGETLIDGNFKDFSTSTKSENNAVSAQDLNNLQIKNLGKMEKVAVIMNPQAVLIKRSENYPYIFVLEYNKNSIHRALYETVLNRISEAVSIIFSFLILLFLIYREITQTQKSTRFKIIAKRANQGRLEFLVKSAHEFKNFIFGIQGCAEVIRDDLKKLQQAAQKNEAAKKLLQNHNIETDIEFARDIIEASHDLDSFINQLVDVDYAKEHELQINPSATPVNVAQIIKTCIKALEKRAHNSEVDLISDIEEKLHKISKIDDKILKQLLTNLISNSIKNSKASGAVVVTATNIDDRKTLENIYKIHGIRKEKAIEIVIRDEGFGINQKEIGAALSSKEKSLNHARAFATRLPNIKYLIEKQGGIFEIKSDNNLGNKFRIIL